MTSSKKVVKKANALYAIKEAFLSQVNSLKTQSDNFHANEFATANDALYQMLADIYDTHDLMTNSTSESKAKRHLLKSLCDNAGYTFTKKTPHIVDMLVKFVFSYDEKNKRRLSTYIRCIKICVAETSVYCGTDASEYIKKCGGVEEVIRSLSKATTLTDDKLKVAKDNFANKKVNVTIRHDEVTENVTSLLGSYVVLVGVVTESGDIEVKHLCADKAFGNRQKNFGASVVNSALANMGSVINANEAANKSVNDAEKQAQNENAELLGTAA